MKYLVGLIRSTAPSALLALALVSAPVGLRAQEDDGVKIRAIEVQYTGPETITRERILSQMRTKVGQTYSPGVVEEDIKNLYATGKLQNVRIFGQNQGDGVKVIVAVQARVNVNEIEIAGATRFSAKALRKKIKLKVNSPIDDEALGKARQDILDAYRAKGFSDVDVQYKIDTNVERGTSRVVFTINEGEKGTVSRVIFEGNSRFSDRALRKKMKTKPKTVISFLDKSGRLNEAQLQQDLDAIREHYQDNGYIDVEVQSPRRERSEGRMMLVIPIVEGQKYTVGKITVKGMKVTTEQRVLAGIKMKEGSVYSPKAIREDAKAIAEGYGAGGYVDLMVTPQGVPSGPGRIDINYTIEEGEKAFVQRINIVGNTRTKDKVIRREVLIAPGDIYSTTRVETTKKRLDNLGYFSRVEAYPEDTGVTGRKDLVIEVEEKRTGSFNFGAGFSTIDNVVGFVELTQGNFDLMNWPNFTGGGQKFRARVQYGAQRKDLILALTEPYFLDRRLSLSGEMYYREANFLSSVYDQRNYGFSISARRPLGAFTAVSLEYRLEEVEIFNMPLDVSEQLGIQRGKNISSKVTANLTYDTRDNPYLTRRGRRVSLTPYGAGGFLGGDTQIYGFNLEGSQYYTFPYDIIFLFNAEIASVDSWGDEGDNDVPIYERLFLGGSNNLRGFGFRDVGPKDVNGEPVGGRFLARSTVEVTFPIIEKVRGAVFYDIGVVGPEAFEPNGRAASDVGFGLRLNLPVGPLRLDYGFPVTTGGNNKREGKFNFNVGYQF